MIDETKAPDPLPEALPIGTEFADARDTYRYTTEAHWIGHGWVGECVCVNDGRAYPRMFSHDDDDPTWRVSWPSYYAAFRAQQSGSQPEMPREGERWVVAILKSNGAYTDEHECTVKDVAATAALVRSANTPAAFLPGYHLPGGWCFLRRLSPTPEISPSAGSAPAQPAAGRPDPYENPHSAIINGRDFCAWSKREDARHAAAVHQHLLDLDRTAAERRRVLGIEAALRTWPSHYGEEP